MKSEIEWPSFRVLISGYYVHLFLKFTSKLLPAALEVLIYSGSNFFASAWLHDFHFGSEQNIPRHWHKNAA